MNNLEKTQTKPCRACRGPIDSLATKCNHCEAFQDWRHIGSGLVPIGSLIVAAMSLLITAFALWPSISDLIWPKRAYLNVEYETHDSSNDLEIRLANLSTLPVLIQKLQDCPHKEEGMIFLKQKIL